MVDIKKYSDMDLYGLIGIDNSATIIQIRKAYRKKALECHPDKNPDNPKAAELFHELSKALEILTDETARSAYDKILNSKKAAELRNKQLDSKRQKLKSDLEARERLAHNEVYKKQKYTVTRSPEEILKDQIDRLRHEGSRLLEEEQEMMKQQIQDEKNKLANQYDSTKHRIKIKWNSAKLDTTNGGYNEEILRKYLQKYGDITALIISSRKNGSALIEFSTQDASEMAILYEKGNLNNPLILEWITEPKVKNKSSHSSSTIKDTDYESLVLRQMRQAEERKKLIEQMINETDE